MVCSHQGDELVSATVAGGGALAIGKARIQPLNPSTPLELPTAWDSSFLCPALLLLAMAIPPVLPTWDQVVIGAITYAYLRNRICAPRNMSAGAAAALRTATDQLLVGLY